MKKKELTTEQKQLVDEILVNTILLMEGYRTETPLNFTRLLKDNLLLQQRYQGCLDRWLTKVIERRLVSLSSIGKFMSAIEREEFQQGFLQVARTLAQEAQKLADWLNPSVVHGQVMTFNPEVRENIMFFFSRMSMAQRQGLTVFVMDILSQEIPGKKSGL